MNVTRYQAEVNERAFWNDHGVRWLGLKLKIGDYDIPERYLRSVVLYPESSSVAFAGVLVGEQRLETRTSLRRLAETKAIPFEAVDKNGVSATGLCEIKDLKLDAHSAPIIRFSGRLVRPFQD